MDLPAGLTCRPLMIDDVTAVHAVMAAQELEDTGGSEIEVADLLGDWQDPDFDVSTSTIGVLDGRLLVAYGEKGPADRADAAVHPAYRGRGIGTAIAHWIRARAAEQGARVVGMPVALDTPGDRLLEALGWQVRWESWVLVLPEGRDVATQPLPAGHEMRTATSEADHRAAWTLLEDAFLEWSVRDRTTFEAFTARTVQRPGFRPWQLRLLVDPGGEAVGACFATLDSGSAWVDRIAVRRDRRGHGLARALLADAFGLAREHGARTLKLSTDSRTGALGLYLRVGMEVASTWVNRAIRTDEVRA